MHFSNNIGTSNIMYKHIKGKDKFKVIATCLYNLLYILNINILNYYIIIYVLQKTIYFLNFIKKIHSTCIIINYNV